MNSSESAEELIKISLQGFEMVARITGTGATYVSKVIFEKLKEKKMSKGKTSLKNMLKSGSELKIFSLKDKNELKKFHEVAKKYGVLYTAIISKNNKDGYIDIMLRAEDAPKVNWIIDKFNLAAVDIASIKSEVEKDKMEEMMQDAKERGVKVKTYEEELAEDLLSKKEVNESSNPKVAKTEKVPPLEPSLENKKDSGVVASKNKKPSIRGLLKKIKEDNNSRNPSNKQKANQEIAKDSSIIDNVKKKTKNNKNSVKGNKKNVSKSNKRKER